MWARDANDSFEQLKYMSSKEGMKAMLDSYIASRPKRTPHWKETQSEDDKNEKLEKARLKRERKAKSKGTK